MSTGKVTAPDRLASSEFSPLDAVIAILTVNNRVMSWDPKAESMTGYTLESVNQREVIHLFEPVEVMQQMLRKAQAGAFSMNERVELRTADGRRLPVVVQCLPLQSRQDSEAQTVLVVRQPTPSQEWQRHEVRMQVLGRLAGALSHEIRNPLNAIFLHTDIVEEEVRQPTPGDRSQVLRSLATIKMEGARLQTLMQDYLFLARLSDLQRTPEELGALIADLILEMSIHDGARKVTLVLSGNEHLGAVLIHGSLFRRALSNLLQRLIETIPENGTLILQGQRTRSHLHLSIYDIGQVIPDDAWTAFRAALQATNPGTGLDLGVYVAREIIAAHGGEVVLTKAPDTGMQCTVTLPLDTQQSDSSASSPLTLNDPA